MSVQMGAGGCWQKSSGNVRNVKPCRIKTASTYFSYYKWNWAYVLCLRTIVCLSLWASSFCPLPFATEFLAFFLFIYRNSLYMKEIGCIVDTFSVCLWICDAFFLMLNFSLLYDPIVPPPFFSFMSCELCIMLRKAFPTLRSFKILSCFLLLLLCFNFLPSNLWSVSNLFGCKGFFF